MANKPTMKPATTNVLQLADQAKKQERQEHQDKEKDKVGVLRGGTSGALVNGQVLGKCHRLALLRYLGIEEPKDNVAPFYFDLGYANEGVWEKRLTRAWQGPIRREEETPIKWQVETDSGQKVAVTGRPDVVLCGGTEDSPVPTVGIELKAVSSLNTAANLIAGGSPKTDNLIQAAHYSWKLDVPYVLLYTIYATGSTYAKGKGKVKVKPTNVLFHLGWDDGGLYYIKPSGQRVDTVVTTEAIEDYYKLIPTMAEEKNLYQRYPSLDAELNPAPYSACTYCPFKTACDKYEGNYDRWLDEARLISETGGNDENSD